MRYHLAVFLSNYDLFQWNLPLVLVVTLSCNKLLDAICYPELTVPVWDKLIKSAVYLHTIL